jgi:hypothetical protein
MIESRVEDFWNICGAGFSLRGLTGRSRIGSRQNPQAEACATKNYNSVGRG